MLVTEPPNDAILWVVIVYFEVLSTPNLVSQLLHSMFWSHACRYLPGRAMVPSIKVCRHQ